MKWPVLTEGQVAGGAAVRQALERSGALLLVLPAAAAAALADLKTRSLALFEAAAAAKAGFCDPETLTGYRRVGIEYSRVPERPDLMESLSYCALYRRRLQARAEGAVHPAWLAAAATAAARIDPLLCAVMAGLAAGYGRPWPADDGASPFALASILQVNHYTRRLMTRALLQDSHEDGNLLTMLSADGPGLEVAAPAGGFVPVTPPAGQILVFPGQIVELLTGGAIRALHHRVARDPAIDRRHSVMYFGNPAPGVRLTPWRGPAGLELSAMAWANPRRYGLPLIRSDLEL